MWLMSIIARGRRLEKETAVGADEDCEASLPYEYHRLTEEERKAVLKQREAHGYPLHAPPHPYQVAGRFLLTAANYEHKLLMAAADRRTEFEADLVKRLQAAEVCVLAWVVLPNHYHVLVETETLLRASVALRRLHGGTSRAWNLADGMTGIRTVWYHFSDRRIRDEAHQMRALNYVHFNPVKHGYVNDAYEWPWSSLRDYADAYGREWLREKWRQHPPGVFGKGWDD